MEYMDSMLAADQFKQCQPPQENERELTEVIIHMSPLSVTCNHQYIEFMERLVYFKSAHSQLWTVCLLKKPF